MRIEDTSNITSIQDYRKSAKIKASTASNPSAPARITDFKVLSSLHKRTLTPMTKDEVRAVLDPDGFFPQKKEKQNTQEPVPINSNLIDFDTIASLYPNIAKTNESELVEFCLGEGYDLTYEQATKAIARYKQDAVEAKPVFEEIDRIKKEFEGRIKDIDFSSLEKVKSIYEKKDKREMLANYETPNSFIPSKQSSKVSKNIAGLYVKQLQSLLPDYDFEATDDGTVDATNNVVQVSVSKDNYYLMFFFNDFIRTLKNGKIGENFQCYIESPNNGKYSWHYDGPERILSKINKLFSGAVGAVSKDSYNASGEPEFYVDAQMESGPAYYAVLENGKPLFLQEKKPNIDETSDLSEEEIKSVEQIVLEDEGAKKYFEEYGKKFVLSCVRDGKFNSLIAEAQSSLYELGQYFSSDAEISFDYIESIIKHIENEDHTIDRNLFELANDFLISELNSKENHHKTIFAVLDYLKTHKSARVFNCLDNLADEDLFNFEEVDEIIKILKDSTDKKQKVVINKLNKLVRKYDENADSKPDTRIFEQLMLELH